jgi:hypothetical protein
MIDDTAPGIIAAEPAATPAAHAAAKACANCGAPMLGPFCHACGQPEKGMIRHLASVLSDVADTIFNIDSRLFRSILPLYFRPGYLTCEYFAGRRTRYVTPFRLFFFLCIISFFAIQANLSVGDIVHFDVGEELGNAQTSAEVQAKTDSAVAALEATRDAVTRSSSGTAKVDRKIAEIRKKADARLAYLKARADAQAKGEAPPKDPDADNILQFNDGTWDPVANPIRVSWLPAFANTKLNELAARAKDNLIRARHDQRQLVAGLFSVLPQTLFVLMPLFAVLLKIVYIFKRRLYMEHLMVALHSHAFIFLSLLLIELLGLLLGWAASDATWAAPALKLLRAAVWTWLPVYLFLMQKRVYRQGWIMTTLKYWLVGICYIVILSLGLVGALVAALAIA